MKLIVGLGNPGRAYLKTRHNVGFLVIDRLALRYEIPLKKKDFQAIWGRGFSEDNELILAKPQTYMNLSGISVKGLIKHFSLDSKDLIVIHDDLDMVLGKIKIREKGKDGGHKGIRSIIDKLQTDKFVRVKIGIGRPKEGEDPVDYVLSPFLKIEEEEITKAMEKAVLAVEEIVKRDLYGKDNTFMLLTKDKKVLELEGDR